MKIAVGEMLKSRAEHTIRIDPLVGAVLVDPSGKELGRAHRGHLRTGHHAEFTLLERMSSNMDLTGSTLYVTLEPCIIRNFPKVPCAKHIVNARIKKVFVGIPDPSYKIMGKGINFLQKNHIEVDFFDLDFVEQIRKANKDFIEQHENEEEKFSEIAEEFEGISDKTNEPVRTASLKDLSYEEIRRYLEVRGKEHKIPSEELWNYLTKLGFLYRDHPSEGLFPTVAAILLFGNDPVDFLVQSKVLVEAHKGDKITTEDFSGPLLQILNKVEDFFKQNVRSITEIKGFNREKNLEFPLEALREAVVNAIVHRDYSEGARVHIKAFENKVIVRSPGLPPKPLTLEKMRSFEAPPYSRNPLLAITFHYFEKMEERGAGLEKMRKLMVDNGLSPPRFDFDSGYVVVTFFGSDISGDLIRISEELMIKLNDTELKIVEFVKKNKRVTSSDIRKILGITRETANQHLKKLIEEGIIEKRGAGPSTYYVFWGS